MTRPKLTRQIVLPPLPFNADELKPVISAETLELHHGKHHKAYVDKTNDLIENGQIRFKESSLEQIVLESEGALFNNAAQAWNHQFYWQSLKPPTRNGSIPGTLETALVRHFGSIEAFKTRFAEAAVGQFGSGWAWLVKSPDGKLEITHTANAENPLKADQIPLLTCDVWEHAYYLDYRNERARYVSSFWEIVNWDFAVANLELTVTYRDAIRLELREQAA